MKRLFASLATFALALTWAGFAASPANASVAAPAVHTTVSTVVPLSDPPPPEITSGPTVTGDTAGSVLVGQELNCAFTANAAFNDQDWRRDGVLISGEIRPKHVVTAADAGHVLTCHVAVAQYGAGPYVEKDSRPINVLTPPSFDSPPVLTVQGVVGSTPTTVEPGAVLNCAIGGARAYDSFVMGFRRDAVPFVQAATYVVLPADAGKRLDCGVALASAAGQASGVSNSVLVRAVVAWVNTPAMTGPSKVDSDNVCAFSAANAVGDAQYQWLLNGAPKAGATFDTYRVAFEDRGQALSCRVTVTDGVNAISADSAAVTVAGNPRVVDVRLWTAPTVDSPQGQVNVMAYGMNSTGKSFQWYVDGTPMAGYTSDTIMSNGSISIVGRTVSCLVTVFDETTSVTAMSQSVFVSPSSVSSPTPTPTVTPTPQGVRVMDVSGAAVTSIAVGSKIRVDVSAVLPAGKKATVKIQWQAQNAGGGKWRSLAKGKKATLKAAKTTRGKSIRARVKVRAKGAKASTAKTYYTEAIPVQ